MKKKSERLPTKPTDVALKTYLTSYDTALRDNNHVMALTLLMQDLVENAKRWLRDEKIELPTLGKLEKTGLSPAEFQHLGDAITKWRNIKWNTGKLDKTGYATLTSASRIMRSVGTALNHMRSYGDVPNNTIASIILAGVVLGEASLHADVTAEGWFEALERADTARERAVRGGVNRGHKEEELERQQIEFARALPVDTPIKKLAGLLHSKFTRPNEVTFGRKVRDWVKAGDLPPREKPKAKRR